MAPLGPTELWLRQRFAAPTVDSAEIPLLVSAPTTWTALSSCGSAPLGSQRGLGGGLIVRISRPLSLLSAVVVAAGFAGAAPVAAQDASPSAEPTPVVTAPPGETEVKFRFDWIETPGDTAVRA